MTKTDLCNRALALLGHDRSVTDYDGMTGTAYNDTSTEAVRCRQFYPAALADVLAESDWDFAAVVFTATLAHADAQGWARFAQPDDCLRLSSASDEEGRPLPLRRNRDYAEVRSHGRTASVRYVSSDIDETDAPHLFREAFAARLAFLLAGPMFGDDQKTNAFYQLYKTRLADAVSREANETAYTGRTDNPFIAARR